MRFFEVFTINVDPEVRNALENAEVDSVNRVLHGGFLRIKINSQHSIAVTALRSAEEAVKLQLLEGMVDVHIENISDYEYVRMDTVSVSETDLSASRPKA